MSRYLTIMSLLSASMWFGCGESMGPDRLGELEVTPVSVTIIVDSTYTLSAWVHDAGGTSEAEGAVWLSSEPEIATVDEDGVITGLAPGSSVITAEWRTLRDSATVVVAPAAAAIEVSSAVVYMILGGSHPISATLVDGDGNTLERALRWSTSDASVAAVDSTGRVTGVGEGSAVITVAREGVAAEVDVEVDSLSFASVSVGYMYACGVTDGGVGYCWGWNDYGTLGDGTTEQRLWPVRVAGVIEFAEISAGYRHTCGLSTSGQAYCWGHNGHGELGDGTLSDSPVPVAVNGGPSFVAIGAGSREHTCALAEGGAAYCWGQNVSGELGDGTRMERPTPVAVSGGLAFQTISAGGGSGSLAHSCGVTVEGDGYCWGDNLHGQLGTGVAGGSAPAPAPVTGGMKFRSLDAGFSYTCGVTVDDIAYCWGHNDWGMLGRGFQSNSEPIPEPVSGDIRFGSIDGYYQSTCGVATDGSAYCWGWGWDGQLGQGEIGVGASSFVPLQVTGGLAFRSVSPGYMSSCGVSQEPVLYCWGSVGALGLGFDYEQYGTANFPSPVPVLGQGLPVAVP